MSRVVRLKTAKFDNTFYVQVLSFSLRIPDQVKRIYPCIPVSIMHARAGKAVLTALPTSDQQRVITTSVSSSPTIYEACCLEQQTPRTPLKPPSLPIGVTERKEPIDSPIKYFGIFFARAGPNDLSKHSGVHSVLDQEIRHNAMVEEVRVPAETAEGSTVPSQTVSQANSASELS